MGNKTGVKTVLNTRRQRIISEMRDNPNVTTAHLQVILNCFESTVDNNISFLKKNGFIERVGSKKTGYWKIL